MENTDILKQKEVIGNAEAGEPSVAPGTSETSKTNETGRKPGKRKRHPALNQMETHSLVLANVADQPDIAKHMAEMGYTSEVLDTGRALYEESIEAFKQGSLKKSQVLSANKEFRDKWEVLTEKFRIHFEKARVVFRRNESALLALSLKGNLPKGYLTLKARMIDFYTKISEESIMQEMARLNFTAEDLDEGLTLLNEVSVLRAIYMKKKAEAQDATVKRNATFRNAEKWMQDFFAVAKIAVRESPQLQEAFGKVVRN